VEPQTADWSYRATQKYANIANVLLTKPLRLKIVRKLLPMHWPLLIMTNIPFVMHCYGKQRMAIAQNKCVICKSMQSQIQIKPQ